MFLRVVAMMALVMIRVRKTFMENKKTLLLILLACLAVFSVFYYLSMKRVSEKEKQNQIITEKTQLIKEYQNNLDLVSAQKEQEALVKEYEKTGEKEKQLNTMRQLAYNYNKAGDFKKGIALFKDVIFDPAATARIKSEAVASMTHIYYRKRWKEPLQEIFRDSRPLFANAWGTGDINNMDDLEFALNRLHESVNKEYPLSYLDYMIALWYSGKVLDNKFVDTVEKDRNLDQAKMNLALGDVALDKESSADDYTSGNFSYDFSGTAKHFRFVLYTFLARADSSYIEKTDAAYKERMNTYARYPNVLSVRLLEAYTRFYYAALLADISGESKKAEIADIVKPTISTTGNFEKTNASVQGFYQQELTRPQEERGHNEKFILKVASLVPEFNSFLVSKGWKQ